MQDNNATTEPQQPHFMFILNTSASVKLNMDKMEKQI